MRLRECVGEAQDSMAPHAPQIASLISVAVTAAAMVIQGRRARLLEARRPIVALPAVDSPRRVTARNAREQ
jgi:hypothetical protein